MLRKKPVLILSNESCEEQAFPYLLSKDKYNYNASGDIQYSASDADYLFFAKPVYEQHHLHSPINFALHKKT